MARGSFERRLRSHRSAEECWAVLTDVDRLAGWVEIVHGVVTRSPLANYEATLEDRVGPFELRANLTVTVTEATPPASIRFSASGEDRQVGSRLTVDGGVCLEPVESGTEICFDGSYSVEGRIATLGGSMIQRKANRIVEEFLFHAEEELR